VDNLPFAPVANILRQRLIEDMMIRGFSEKTPKYYIRIVAGFAAFLERSPSRATAAQVRLTGLGDRECAWRVGSIWGSPMGRPEPCGAMENA
jgi:hypothetical protein